MLNRSRRRQAALVAVVAGSIFFYLSACTRRPDTTPTTSGYDPSTDPLVNPPSLFQKAPADDPDAIADDETLVRLLESSPASLGAIFQSSTYDFYVADALHDGLFSLDSKMQWFVNDSMVESFEESEDHLVSKVKLRPDLKWHDGHPLTASDVRFSWEVILDPRVPCSAVKPGTDQIADVRVLDERTLEFVHKEALPTNKWNMLFPIIPEHIYGKPEEREKDPSLQTSDYYILHNRKNVIGCGAYRLVEWSENDRIVVERWEDYHGPRPHFKRQIFKIQPDRNVALMLFKDEQIDEMQLTEQQFVTQTGEEDFGKVGVKAYAPRWAYYYVAWNMDGSNPFFTDRRVRRAMAHALNLPRLIRTVAHNLSTRCLGIYHPGSWMFDPEIDPIEFDLAEAARLLEQSEWLVDNERGGWRYKEINGSPVKFEFSVLLPQGSTVGPPVAAVFQQDLKSIGVSLKMRVVEGATFAEMARKHEFQALTAGWSTGTDPDTGWNLWRSDQYDGGRNYGGFKNDRVDRLYELGRAEFDQEKRAAHYREIQKIIYDEQPYLFLWNRSTTWAFHKRLRGIEFSPRGVFNFSPSVMGWWVPTEEKLR